MWLWFTNPPAHASDYDDTKAEISARVASLREEFDLDPEATLRAAREALADSVQELLPHWEGTTWAMNGTSEVPGEGRIACGYLVSTVLRDAGLPVDRVKLAQQASENIVATLVDEADVARYREAEVTDVLREARTPGIYVVGLDTHVGMLVVTDQDQTFCHSSRSHDQEVVCEVATAAKALHSHYLVIGRLSERAVEAWVTNTPLATVLQRAQN